MTTKHLLKRTFCFIALFIIYLLFARYTESIPVSSGLGWDGVRYAKIAIAPIETLKSGELPTNCIQRIIPSIISYIIIDCMQREHNNQNVIISFQILNALSLTTALIFWIKICSYFKFKRNYVFLGTILCFINFHFIKFYSYYPVLTDYFSFSLCIVGFYYWLKNNHYKLLIISSIIAFSWPSALFQFLILMCFPYQNNQNTNHVKKSTYITIDFKYLMLIFFITYIYILYLIENKSYIDFEKPSKSFIVLGTINYFIICSLICAIISNLEVFSLKTILKQVYIKFILLSVSLLAFIKFIIFITPSYSDIINKKYILELFLVRSFELPFINLLSHTIVLSPVIIITLINFKKTSEVLNSFGLGAKIIFFLSIPFLFNSETRHLLHFYPFIVIIFLLSKSYNTFFIYFIFLLQLFISSLYLNLNTTEGCNNDLLFCFISPFIRYKEYISFLLPLSLSVFTIFLLAYHFTSSTKSTLSR